MAAHPRPGRLAACLLGAAAVTAGCAAHLPKAPPPPTTSKGVATTTSAPTSTVATTSTTTSRGGRSATSGPGPAIPSSTSTSRTSTTAPAATTTVPPAANVTYNLDAVANYGVGPQPSNWNIHAAAAGAAYPVLAQVLAQVWPSAFQAGPSGATVLNNSLLTSAQQVGTNPQTVVYQVNPRAVWSDGTPVTYRDFVYNWEAQSGRAQFSDAGGRPFQPVETAGYDDIASVRGTAASPFTVTVTFSTPFPEWRSLFSYLAPAHVAGTLGFNHGFTDPVRDLVSAGPFVVSELQPGYSLELVRNARYWGSPANLSSVTYYFMSTPAQAVDALSAGELQVAALAAAPSDWLQLQAVSGLSVQAVASSGYEDLDFNESAGPFGRAVLREAVMMSVDRGGMASTVLGPYGLAAKPVENRAFLPGAPGYFPNGTTFDQPVPTTALELLGAAGYSVKAGHLTAPGGAPVAVTLAVSASDPVAGELADQVVASCAAIGLKVTVVPRLPGPRGWDLAIERREVPEWPSALAARYRTGGGENADGYSNKAMDALLAQAGAAPAAGQATVYDQADDLAWKDFVDLPLVPVPVVFAAGRGLLNLEPGPYYANLAWDEQEWGFGT